MIEWWSALSAVMKVVWAVTLSASLIFVIQTILTFIGADSGGDFDTDGGFDFHDGSTDVDFEADPGMNLYTFRNFVIFFMGFGWTVILLRNSISSIPLLMILGIIVALGLVAIVVMLFRWLNSMQSSGTINVYKSALGCQGRVYLTIPAERTGTGKIQISINNAIREYDAQTDESEPLKTGEAIKVIEVLGPTTMLVEKFNTLII